MHRIWSPAYADPAYLAGLVESYFLRINEPSGKWAAWIKFTLRISRSPRARTGDCWFIFFDRAGITGTEVQGARETFSDVYIQARGGPGHLLIGDNRLTPELCAGHIPSRSISWRFSYASTGTPCVIAPWSLSPLIPGTKLTTPVPEGFASGVLEVGGRRIPFENCPMSLGHNWGRRHAQRYAWAQARCSGVGNRFFFEGFCLPLGRDVSMSPQLAAGAVLLDGAPISFAGPGSLINNRAAASPGRLNVEFANADWVLTGDVAWDEKLVAALRYIQPDGRVATCRNSMLAQAAFSLRPTQSNETGLARTFEVPSNATLEFLSPGPPTEGTVLA